MMGGKPKTGRPTKTYETTGSVLAEAVKVKSVTLLIRYDCDLEHLRVEELLEGLRENGGADIIEVQPHTDGIHDVEQARRRNS